MSFGIQGKVALLVIAATAASALLVAKVLTDPAPQTGYRARPALEAAQ